MAGHALRHPDRHLIRDLWPDKHLYASVLLMLGAALGAAFALVAAATPITYAPDLPTYLQGGGLLVGLVSALVAGALAVGCYTKRAPWMGFTAAAIEFLSFGALGIASVLALVATLFLLRARYEGEHESPHTRDLHASLWPDKALAASLLLIVVSLVSFVWAAALLTGTLEVRGVDARAWGIASLVAGLLALVCATLAYRQRAFVGCVVGAALVTATGGFVVLGPALALASIVLLVKARGEGEFASAR